MEYNVPEWSYEALGRRMTVDEFIADPKAQDLVAQYKMHNLLKRHSKEDVVSIWFTGQPLEGNEHKQDANGTVAKDYVNQVIALMK